MIDNGAMNITRHIKNLQGEVDSAALYHAMSEREPDQISRKCTRASLQWRDDMPNSGRAIIATGGIVPTIRPGWRTKFLIWLNKCLGAAPLLPVAAMLEQIDRSQYDDQPETRYTHAGAGTLACTRTLSARAGQSPPYMERRKLFATGGSAWCRRRQRLTRRGTWRQ